MQATDPSNTADRNASKLEDLSAEELGQIVEDAVRCACASHFSRRKNRPSHSKKNPMRLIFHNAGSGLGDGTTKLDAKDGGTRIDEGSMDRSRQEQGSVSALGSTQEAENQGGITLQIRTDPTMTVDQLLAVPDQIPSESDTAQSGCSGWPGTVGPRSEIVIDHEDEDSGQYRQPDTPWDPENSTRVVLYHTDDGTWARFEFDATPTRAMELRQQRRVREQGTDVY